jgi:protocatechuate 3,4-dioxygenase beta subunit
MRRGSEPDAVSALTRRRLLEGAALVPVALVLARCGGEDAEPLAATPSCDDHGGHTEAQTKGPYFTPDSPRRASLVAPGVRGTPLVLAGRVLSTACRPLRGALLDFWQADGRGVYDNRGYRLRGHQFTNAEGRFRLTTVLPGLYPGRTRHIHVKVQPRGGRVLTTQLYFPGEPRNRSDGIYDPDLLMRLRRVSGGRRGSFDFVVGA